MVRDGFGVFAEALAKVRGEATSGRLRITTTNAFAARWLVPRLPDWRTHHPRLKLDIIGTDAVLDLESGEADIAIRYARAPPADVPCVELVRDSFGVVASPKLVGKLAKPLQPAELATFPLIEIEWPVTDSEAPSWQRWQKVASRGHKPLPDLSALPAFSFREEAHAIEAAIAGQGLAICSDVLVARELASGALIPVSQTRLPGYGFYVVHRACHPKLGSIKAFIDWARSAVSARPQSG